MTMVARGGRWVLGRKDEGYPPSLELLEDPPEELRGIGDPSALGAPCISIIGARRATPYGIAVAEIAGRVAAECGLTVVSGGAMGCDCAALRAAARSGGRCVIVSGCGADRVYPASSSDMFERAAAGEGAVISLEPWGQGPRRWAFPKRNRIIAALSRCVLIAEAGVKSGTMSTADAAVEMGRTLYAVPGSIFSPQSAGANTLIANGAAIISSEVDLEVRISYDYGCLRFVGAQGPTPSGRILSALTANPMRPDDLARALGEDVVHVLNALSDYELQGLVVRLRDGRFSPSAPAFEGQGTIATG